MYFKDIKRHPVPYRIYARRKTSINHAFAAAIAPCDDFVEDTVKNALRLLGQDPELKLSCISCDGLADLGSCVCNREGIHLQRSGTSYWQSLTVLQTLQLHEGEQIMARIHRRT